VRLVLATDDLVIEGRSFAGFPLLIGDDGWPVEPAQSFLWDVLTLGGSAESLLTWEAYGRWLYDFLAFLNANELEWNAAPSPHGLSVVARYRDWSLTEANVGANTVNKRLNIVVRFYEWCKERGLVTHLPFGRRDVRIPGNVGFLEHVNRGKTISKATVLVKERKPTVKLLTKEQVRIGLRLNVNESHRLLFHLMVRVGLRSCEARTFPQKYVFNPRTRRDVQPGQMIRVGLDPRDMHIKFNKPRSVDVPWSLMADMWAYSLHEREKRRQVSGNAPKALVLTANGSEYSKDAVVDVMKAIEKVAGFPVRAHMLRHSYGTYTLAALRKAPNFEGEPLLYVRDRMGHSDVQTTAIYLHLINQLDAQAVLAHEDEIDMLFAGATSASQEATA
jgi:integrase